MIFSLFIYDVFPVIRYVNKKASFRHIFLHMSKANRQKRVQYKYSTVSSAVVFITVQPYISVNLPANLNDNTNNKHTISVIYGPFFASFSLPF